VLVGGALVAVDRDALVYGAAVEVFLLAERLHDQLLQVAAEEREPVLVGQDHHVLRAPATARVVPGEREQRGRVAPGIARSRQVVHARGALEQAVHVDALQGGGQ